MEIKTTILNELTVDGKGSYGIAASAVEPRNDLFTYLRITDINDDGTLNKSGLKCVDAPDAVKYLLEPNDLVFARTGASTGRNYFYDGNDGRFVYAGFLIKFSIDPTKVNPRYLKYYCLSNQYKNWVDSFSTGSTRGNINAQTFGNMPVPIPPREQQDHLVDVLQSIDEKIRINQKINDNLMEQAQAIFKSWFIDFEPFISSGLKSSPLGNIPIDWEVKQLGEITQYITTRVKNRQYKVLSAINTGNLILSEEYFSKQVFSKSIEKYIVVETNDFAYNPARVNIGSIGINDLGFIGCVSPVYVVFRTQSEYCYFFKLFLQTLRFKEEVKVRSSGSVRQVMNYDNFSLIQIVYPPKEVVEKFNPIYEQFVKNINRCKQENQRLAELRDTLLPRLMSGELDVSEAEL